LFRENLGLRIFSLVLAVFVWLQSNLITEHRSVVSLPVNLKSVPKNITLEKLPSSIPFHVKGKGLDIIKLMLSRTQVSIDASSIKPGVDIISLSDYTIDLPENINVTLLGPAEQQEIAVHADVFHQKRVPIRLGFADSLTRQRFANLKYQIIPDKVIVFGPRNKVQSIDSASTELISAELANETEFVLKLASVADDVSFSETQVRVRVSNSFNTSKVFDNLSIATDGRSAFPPKAAVKLSGDSELLNQLNPSSISVKISDIADENGFYKLIAEAPNGTAIEAITPQKVRIK
jgi:FlaG/FlaF family flagellin (archaellin)